MDQFIILKFSLIAFTIVPIWIVVISYIQFTGFRNIYTQKIRFLNEEFSRLSEDQIGKYRIGKFKKFRQDMQFESLFPPKVIPENLINQEYENLVTKFNRKQTSLPKTVKTTLTGYLIVLGIHFILYIILTIDW